MAGTPNAIRIVIAAIGLAMLAVSTWLARRAGKGTEGALRQAKAVGLVSALCGWSSFWAQPPFHGGVNFVALLLLACACPLVAVERGHVLAGRVFVWSSLALAILVAMCDRFVEDSRLRGNLVSFGYLSFLALPPMGGVGVLLVQHLRRQRVSVA